MERGIKKKCNPDFRLPGLTIHSKRRTISEPIIENLSVSAARAWSSSTGLARAGSRFHLVRLELVSVRSSAAVTKIMTDKSIEAPITEGAFAYENWKAALSSAPERSVFEHPLFSDAHFSIVSNMKTEFGPYLLYNTQSRGISPSVPSFILRIKYHLDSKIPDLKKTDISRFHGGGLADELAALISLSLRVRLKAGGMTRLFLTEGSDPKGQPFVPYEDDPALFKRRSIYPILPQVVGEHDVSQAKLVNRFSDLNPVESLALVRAARLYQEALWIAEFDPQSSWLMLVSAVETAANYWRTANETAIERLRTSRPALAELLVTVGGQEHLSQVADMIADYMGATRKFLDFLIEFMPDAPDPRPREHDQHSWETTALKKSLKTVYGWRSRALHGGTPIPFPMCDAPIPSGDGWSEVMVGYGAGAHGGVWTGKAAPMKLHLFEYIVRAALLKWWESMLEPTEVKIQESGSKAAHESTTKSHSSTTGY